MKFQRDVLIEAICERASNDRNLFFLSADFGAPALDHFCEELPEQFLHMGISEQNMVDVAAGLALEGRIVFIYAMAPFVTLRCLEQHKTSTGLMNLPVCTIAAGVGLGYADAGPTHYATEDHACLRSLVNATVYTVSDAATTKAIGENFCENPHYSFIRLDRAALPSLGNDASATNAVEKGYRKLTKGKELCVITNGYMTHRVMAAIGTNSAFSDRVGVIDLIRSKPFPEGLVDNLRVAKSVLVVEEQTPPDALSSAVLEFVCDKSLATPVKRMSLPERYFFDNGGREWLLDDAGLSVNDIASTMEKLL